MIQIALTAEMDHVKTLQQFIDIFTDRFIYHGTSRTAADDQDHRLVVCKTAEVDRINCISVEKLFTDRGSGHDCFTFREHILCLREVATHTGGLWKLQLICKTRCHIRFVDDDRDVAGFGCEYDRNGYKAAL